MLLREGSEAPKGRVLETLAKKHVYVVRDAFLMPYAYGLLVVIDADTCNATGSVAFVGDEGELELWRGFSLVAQSGDVFLGNFGS